MVAQPPPGSGAGFQYHQILRTEQHRGQDTCQLRSTLLFRAVAVDLPGTGAGKQHIAQLLLPLLGKDIALQIRKISPKPDHFGGFLGTEAFSGAKIGDGLQ